MSTERKTQLQVLTQLEPLDKLYVNLEKTVFVRDASSSFQGLRRTISNLYGGWYASWEISMEVIEQLVNHIAEFSHAAVVRFSQLYVRKSLKSFGILNDVDQQIREDLQLLTFTLPKLIAGLSNLAITYNKSKENIGFLILEINSTLTNIKAVLQDL